MKTRAFAGADQPARRSFGITEISCGGKPTPVVTREICGTPFCTLVEFSRADVGDLPTLLVVAPLSGHFPVLLRDLVIGLLPDFKIAVTDWTNIRHVNASAGRFGFESNVATIVDFMRIPGPRQAVIALCQGGVPALTAAAWLAEREPQATPYALVLMGAPIDPNANPTRVSRMLRVRSHEWLESNVISAVPAPFRGQGRLVYPAHLQLLALTLYLERRVAEASELLFKIMADDGSDPQTYPFLDLYTSIMDLDADYFLENARLVYREPALAAGTMEFRGRRISLDAIRETALLTIEGELDDIAAPGQSSAALELCRALDSDRKRFAIIRNSGHFSLFYGDVCRQHVLPILNSFLSRHRRS